jgi:hypothetical protein
MAVGTAVGIDIASVLEELVGSVEGLRAYRYVADNFRPPGAVIALPTIDYDDPAAPFGASSWSYPIAVIVSRNQDRAAQDALARMLAEVVAVVDGANVAGVISVDVISATPAALTVSGQELPAYNVRVRVRA